MDTIYFRIAGFNICISFCDTEWIYIKDKLKKEILAYINSFTLEEKPEKIDYLIDIIWEQEIRTLYFKKEKTAFLKFYTKIANNKTITSYALSIVQFRKLLVSIISELLIRNKGFLLHSSSAKIGNKADIFAGPSGAGKSTIVSLLKDRYPVLSDDISIIRKEKGKYYFYQTPFVDKAFWIKNKINKYQLGRIFFLQKAKYFKTVEITDKEKKLESLRDLYQEFSFDGVYQRKLAKNLFDFIKKINRFYKLYFYKNKEELRGLIGVTIPASN